MSCEQILDMVYSMKDPMPIFARIRIGLHIMACPDCAQEVERFEVCKDLLMEDATAAHATAAIATAAIADEEAPETEAMELPGGFSPWGWILERLR